VALDLTRFAAFLMADARFSPAGEPMMTCEKDGASLAGNVSSIC
jgi:hypothetical protein